jgi:hypothetical protein
MNFKTKYLLMALKDLSNLDIAYRDYFEAKINLILRSKLETISFSQDNGTHNWYMGNGICGMVIDQGKEWDSLLKSYNKHSKLKKFNEQLKNILK